MVVEQPSALVVQACFHSGPCPISHRPDRDRKDVSEGPRYAGLARNELPLELGGELSKERQRYGAAI